MSNDAQPLDEALAALDDHRVGQLLFAVMERLVDRAGPLVAADEYEARSLIATASNRVLGTPVAVEDIAPPATHPVLLARRTLALLARDPATHQLIQETFDTAPDGTQMVPDPLSMAVVLAALVAFLQLKFDVKVRRRQGRLDVDLHISKEPLSGEDAATIIDGVRKAASE